MNYNISFQERAARVMMLLSKQLPVTLEAAKEQAQWLRKNTKAKQKKQRVSSTLPDKTNS